MWQPVPYIFGVLCCKKMKTDIKCNLNAVVTKYVNREKVVEGAHLRHYKIIALNDAYHWTPNYCNFHSLPKVDNSVCKLMTHADRERSSNL